MLRRASLGRGAAIAPKTGMRPEIATAAQAGSWGRTQRRSVCLPVGARRDVQWGVLVALVLYPYSVLRAPVRAANVRLADRLLLGAARVGHERA